MEKVNLGKTATCDDIKSMKFTVKIKQLKQDRGSFDFDNQKGNNNGGQGGIGF